MKQKQQPADLSAELPASSKQKQQPAELSAELPVSSMQPAEPQETQRISLTSVRQHTGESSNTAQQIQRSSPKRAIETQHGSSGTIQEQCPPQPEMPRSRLSQQHGGTRRGRVLHSSRLEQLSSTRQHSERHKQGC